MNTEQKEDILQKLKTEVDEAIITRYDRTNNPGIKIRLKQLETQSRAARTLDLEGQLDRLSEIKKTVLRIEI